MVKALIGMLRSTLKNKVLIYYMIQDIYDIIYINRKKQQRMNFFRRARLIKRSIGNRYMRFCCFNVINGKALIMKGQARTAKILTFRFWRIVNIPHKFLMTGSPLYIYLYKARLSFCSTVPSRLSWTCLSYFVQAIRFEARGIHVERRNISTSTPFS